MDLSRITLLTEYEIVGIDLEEASVRHLADLGIKIGKNYCKINTPKQVLRGYLIRD